MNHKIIFVRHGLRGIGNIHNVPPDHIPYLGKGKSLTFNGYIYSAQLGKYIKNTFGNPDFIYGDITDERTVSSTIAIAHGCDKKDIHFAKSKRDNFFKISSIITPDTIEQVSQNIKKYSDSMNETALIMREQYHEINISNPTKINDKGKITGIVTDMSKLSLLPYSLRLAGQMTIKNEYAFESGHLFMWLIKQPLINITSDLFDGIVSLLYKHQLGILVGHDYSIDTLAYYLEKEYKLPNHPPYYVPPNSGLIFTLFDSHIQIEYIYLDYDGKFHLLDYLDVPNPINKNISFDLIKQQIV